jgi:penicillin amidase
MAALFRWSLRLFTAVAVLLALALALAWTFAARSLPDYDARHRVAGIAGPVEILRDNANVPHIFATTDADVFFGLGFAHAQDRLWQMTMLRRLAQGRLAELFGARAVQTDEFMRRLDLYRAAARSVEAQDAQTRAALAAYAAGVNAWIATVNEQALGRGAPEFFLFSRAIAPWQPADSIAVQKVMALELTGQAQEEVLRARAALVLPPARLVDLLPDAPGAAETPGPDFGTLFPDLPRHAETAPRPDFWPLPESPRLAGASNAWAAAPARAAAGGTLLAGDPHLGFTAPTIWYLAG